MKCRNCKKSNFDRIIKIGKQPISSKTYKFKKKLKKYSLDLFQCKSCKLIQLSKVAPAKDMYGSGYGYWTGLSPLMINHMKKKVTKLKNQKFLKNHSRVLDIGCSDPTFLKLIKKTKKNLELYAVDPSSEKFKNIFNKNKINLIVDYFSKKKIDQFIKDNKISKKKFSLITSFAMFYDIDDPNSFCKDINKMLDRNGIWVNEFSYFPLLLKNLTYDQINHEHVTYYTLTTFKNIISKNGLKIIDVNFNEINGGSAEVVIARKSSKHKPLRKKIENPRIKILG